MFKLFKKKIKPTIDEDNQMYVIDQIMRVKGKNRTYLLTNVSDGLYELIKQQGWKIDYEPKSEIEETPIVFVYFNGEGEQVELMCKTEKLFRIWDKVRKER